MDNKKSESGKEGGPDDYMEAVGEIGRWQMLLYALITIPTKIVLPHIHFGIVFMAPKTSFRCLSRENMTEGIKNMTCYSDCIKYEYNSMFDNTIISQWDLICDKAWIINLSQTLCMLGVAIGGLTFGFISDRYGRRISLISAGAIELCFCFILPYAPDYWSFVAIRFILGLSSAGTMTVGFVMLAEIFGPSKRDFLGCIYALPLGLGYELMAIIAYFFRTWNNVSLGIAVPTIVHVAYVFWLPESPKWLISVGRLDEAKAVMTSAANCNRLPVDKISAVVEAMAKEGERKEKLIKKTTFIDLIRPPGLRLISLCICTLWFTIGLGIYGALQYIGQNTSDPILVITLKGIMMIIGQILGGYMSHTLGRRKPIMAGMGICIIGNGLMLLSNDWYYVKLIAGLIAVSISGASYCLLYVFTTELFPTVARNMGLGASSTFGKIASMLAPFVGNLQKSATWAPPLVFTLLPILAMIACFSLPETRGKKLEDHFEENSSLNVT